MVVVGPEISKEGCQDLSPASLVKRIGTETSGVSVVPQAPHNGDFGGSRFFVEGTMPAGQTADVTWSLDQLST